MGFLGDAINWVSSANDNLEQWGHNAEKGILDDIKSWATSLLNQVDAGVTSAYEGDVVGINANKIPDMIQAIEDYINRINSHLDEIKTNTSTDNAMKGEYALAVKEYVKAACDVCYRITSQLRYFEDKLLAVQRAYTAKDENLASNISGTTAEMNSSWEEYRSNATTSGIPGGAGGSAPSGMSGVSGGTSASFSNSSVR